MSIFAKELRKDLNDSGIFYAHLFDADRVINKKLTDITYDDHYKELTLTFEDGAVIEICRAKDNYIDIQTD